MLFNGVKINGIKAYVKSLFPTDGLISYWSMDNVSGTTISDDWGSNDGTAVNSPTFSSADGIYNNGIKLDGIDDYIDCGTIGSFKTVSMWIKNNGRVSYDFYFGHVDFRIISNLDGIIAGSCVLGNLYSTIDIDSYVGVWSHVVFVSDGVNSKIYFNGADVSDYINGTITSVGSSTVNIGRWTAGTHYANASIDEVAMFNRVLTPEEVGDIYNSGLGRFL